MDFSLNNYKPDIDTALPKIPISGSESGYKTNWNPIALAIGHIFTGGVFGSRHWQMAFSQSDKTEFYTKAGHLFIGTVECIPLVGSIFAIAERSLLEKKPKNQIKVMPPPLKTQVASNLTIKDSKKPTPAPFPTELRSKLEAIFKSKNLSFEPHPSNPEYCICSNSCVADITAIIDSYNSKFPQKDQNPIYKILFFKGYDLAAFCCKLRPEKSKDPFFTYPTGKSWNAALKMIKEDRDTSSKPPLTLTLTDKSMYTEKQFVTNPLFAHTLEKHNVFERLCFLQSQPNFQTSYQDFLQKLKRKDLNWADEYKNKPFDLAYLSLFARLNEEIDNEELFVAQMLASAFLESKDSASHTVLTEENAIEHLEDSNYLPSNIPLPHSLTKILNKYILKPKLKCVEGLNEKSILKRTSVSYTSNKLLDKALYKSSVEDGMHPFGSKEENSSTKDPKPVTITLLPPKLCVEFYKEILGPKIDPDLPPIAHQEYFGYRERFSDLFKGRPISYASPLFYMPGVHGTDSNTQLGITAHDAIFHCPVDWQHPYAKSLAELGKALIDLKKDYQGKKEWPFHGLTLVILDRNLSSVKAGLDRILDEASKLSSDDQRIFFALCKEKFPPGLHMQMLNRSQKLIKQLPIEIEWLKKRDTKMRKQFFKDNPEASQDSYSTGLPKLIDSYTKIKEASELFIHLNKPIPKTPHTSWYSNYLGPIPPQTSN